MVGSSSDPKVPRQLLKLLGIGCGVAAPTALAVAMWVTDPTAQIWWFVSCGMLAFVSVCTVDEVLELKRTWRFLLTVSTGTLIAVLVWWASNYVVSSNEQNLRAAILQAAKESKNSTISKAAARSRPEGRVPTIRSPTESRPPTVTADDLAEAVAKILKPPNQPVSAVEKPCRVEDLTACSDEDLIEWGKPLIKKIVEIHERCSKANSGLKGEALLNVIAAAEMRAAREYRDCCAEDVLAYHKELALRLGGGFQAKSLSEWTEKLLQPEGSADRKDAERQTCTVLLLEVRFELPMMALDLERNRRIKRVRQLQ